MTDFERLVVAWELCRRRATVLARGPTTAPVWFGAAVGACAVGAMALKPLFG